MKRYKIFTGIFSAAVALVACNKNQDITHPDFDYQTVYFASQFPARTVVLGEDLQVDNTLDNEHKVSIKATMGGTRENKNNVVIDFEVAPSLCNNLYFSAAGAKVTPMPSSYYTLASNKITIAPGNVLGGVEVQLTDAFFADPLSLSNNYAIPLMMKSVQGADSILRGSTLVTNPNRLLDADWVIKPRDFVVYVVKFVNAWHGSYLRRGVDVVKGKPGNSSLDRTITRRKTYVEQDEVKATTTKSLQSVELPLTFQNASGVNIPMNLLLTFDSKNDNCTITASGSGYTATGTGKFVKKGEKNSWGGLDRDALYLDYSIDHPLMQITSKDTLVMRNRNVVPEYYTPVVK
ncbi:DUF5627 domain-containing protein [Filimonas effusa]|uniref:DUF1735 domain-containing protein n=1 Tax=Filimonas effusa TaxID=2508721 RepID=A0A4Q1D854_9BACT|nr:DUF5627 domain-containing protein [Filimonas effusa]RXK85497.1 DUF1735 domain-containing protein [Filimonas effusa]